MKGFNDVAQAMQDNPDYENNQAQVKKLIEHTAEDKKKRDEIEKEKNAIKDIIKKQTAAKNSGLKNLKLDQLQALAKQSEETVEQLGK